MFPSRSGGKVGEARARTSAHSRLVSRRRRTLVATLAMAGVGAVLPLALAWACVPGAAIGFDRAVYEYRAGETVTVLGRAFAPSTPVTLKLDSPAGVSTTVGHGVSTDAAGFFEDSFVLPGSAELGAYIVVASVTTTGLDGHGRTYQAAEAFRVVPSPSSVAYPVPPRPLLAPALGTAFERFATRLTVRARPRRDRRLPFTYRFNGRVTLPPGASPTRVCRGTVKLALRRRSITVVKGTARLTSACRYTKRLAIRTTNRTGGRRGKLKAVVVFGGNARLKRSTGRTSVGFF